MANFAVIENGAVTNIILAASKEIAEDVTGLTCEEYNPSTLFVNIGDLVVDGKFGSEIIESEPNDLEAYAATGAPPRE